MNTQPSRSPVRWRSLIGALLAIGGTVLLLDALGLFHFGEWLWAAAAAVAAVLFVLFWARDHAQWWVFIPAGALLGVSLSILSPQWLPVVALDGEMVGTVFLFCLGLGFGVSYLANRMMWWAVIPMGALWTTAVVALLSARGDQTGPGTGSVMFFGMALTFLLVFVIPGGEERFRPWALIPAAILAVIGVLVAGSYTTLLSLIGPITLLAIGLGLLLNNLFRRRS